MLKDLSLLFPSHPVHSSLQELKFLIAFSACVRELWLGPLRPQSDTERSPDMGAGTEGSPLLLW